MGGGGCLSRLGQFGTRPEASAPLLPQVSTPASIKSTFLMSELLCPEKEHPAAVHPPPVAASIIQCRRLHSLVRMQKVRVDNLCALVGPRFHRAEASIGAQDRVELARNSALGEVGDGRGEVEAEVGRGQVGEAAVRRVLNAMRVEVQRLPRGGRPPPAPRSLGWGVGVCRASGLGSKCCCSHPWLHFGGVAETLRRCGAFMFRLIIVG